MTSALEHDRVRTSARTGDEGVALIAAIGVTVVGLLLAMTVASVAIRSSATTGTARDRTQAVAAAEAGLDSVAALFRGLGSAAPAASWCAGSTAAPVALGARTTYATTVTFWRTKDEAEASLADAAVPCVQAKTGAAYARVDSTGRASTGTGAVQTQVMRSVLEMPHSAALHTNRAGRLRARGLVDGPVTVGGLPTGPSPDVVSDTGDVVCESNFVMKGKLVANGGQLTLGDTCRVEGSVRAERGLRMEFSTRVGGDVVTRSGQVWKASSYAPVVVGTETTDPYPESWSAPLPRIPQALLKKDAWMSVAPFRNGRWPTGLTPYTDAPGRCRLPDGPLDLRYGRPTFVDTRGSADCPNGIQGRNADRKIVINDDLVLVVTSLTTDRSFSIERAPGTGDHRVWILAPAPTPSACPEENIYLDDDFELGPGITGLIYSDCQISVQEHTVWSGQIWADDVDWYSYATLHYRQMPTPGDLGPPRPVRVLSTRALSSSTAPPPTP